MVKLRCDRVVQNATRGILVFRNANIDKASRLMLPAHCAMLSFHNRLSLCPSVSLLLHFPFSLQSESNTQRSFSFSHPFSFVVVCSTCFSARPLATSNSTTPASAKTPRTYEQPGVINSARRGCREQATARRRVGPPAAASAAPSVHSFITPGSAVARRFSRVAMATIGCL